MLGQLQTLLNRLLPFATPGTPLLQDVAHLAVICLTLYFGPQIQTALTRSPERQANDRLQDTAVGESDGLVTATPTETEAPPAPRVEDEAEAVDADPDALLPAATLPAAQAGTDNGTTSRQHRAVGAKKAKSLARRDQRRAYHEFMRSQGEAQRARDAQDQDERMQALSRERERRAAVEAEIAAREARVREEKKEAERRERVAEMERRDRAVRLLSTGMERRGHVDLATVAQRVGGVDAAWVETLARASGLLGKKEDRVTIITGTRWLVSVTTDDMQRCYELASMRADEKVSHQLLGELLAGIVRSRPGPEV